MFCSKTNLKNIKKIKLDYKISWKDDIKLNFFTYHMEEFKSFYYDQHVVLTYFKAILGEDNIISKVLGTFPDKLHNTKMIEQAKLNLKVNQIILKELEHESSSTSSDAVEWHYLKW